jgi:hypothetical protein
MLLLPSLLLVPVVADGGSSGAVASVGNGTLLSSSSYTECVRASFGVDSGYSDCGNRAMCPSGYRCTSSMHMSGLRGMCEAQSCDPSSIRGGPLNEMCHGMRTDAHLVCRHGADDDSAPYSNNMTTWSSMGETKSLCDTLRMALPSSCVVNADCFGFQCKVELQGQGIMLIAELNVCDTPATVRVSYDTMPSSGPWVYTITAAKALKVPIPGLTFPIPYVPEVTVACYADAQLSGNIDAFTIKIGLDGCATLLGIEKVCGSDLAKLLLSKFNVTLPLPFYVLGPWTYNFASACVQTFECTSPVPNGKCTALKNSLGDFKSMSSCVASPTCAAPTFNCDGATCTTVTGGLGKFQSMDVCQAECDSTFKIFGHDTKLSQSVATVIGTVTAALLVLCCCYVIRIRRRRAINLAKAHEANRHLLARSQATRIHSV